MTQDTFEKPCTHPSLSSILMSMSERVPPHLYFVVSAVFHYLGPAFAVLLFARVDVLGVAWLRIASAAVVFALWRRPWRAFAKLDRSGRRLLVSWGAVLAVMNACFYVAIDRLPLGTIAAIEFLPVIALAALGARSQRNVVALAMAVAGVYMLTGVHLEGEPLGMALAFANALLFAAYIVLAGIGVGICSSVIPYVSDQLAMRRLPRATYALMVSLLPATATVIGAVVLTQIPSSKELAGVALVIAGVALHREPAEPSPQSARSGRAAPSGPASARAGGAVRHSGAAP